ncbi:MAG: hypothetical protein V4733_01555 [Verrucomicrobiota bacterium]
MSDEQETPAAVPATETSVAQQPADGRHGITPTAWIAFIVIAAAGMLLVTFVRNAGDSMNSGELRDLQAQATVLRENVNRLRLELGRGPREDEGETMEQITKRIKRDADTMVSLAKGLQAMVVEKETEIGVKNGELIHSEQLRQALGNELSRLRMEQQKMLTTGSGTGELRTNLEAASAQRDSLAQQVASLKAELAGNVGGVNGAEFEEMKRRAEEAANARKFFEKRAAELEAELAGTQRFAKSQDELVPAAQELFRSLQGLEGKTDADLKVAYSSIGTELGANVLRTVTFPEGASELGGDEKTSVGALLPTVPEGDLILVVGYAPAAAEAGQTRTLSSDRAAAVVRAISELKPGQRVQAVDLGPTNRFSSTVPERNQLVEIWRIRKK